MSSFTAGQRVTVTETMFGTWDGESGTVVDPTPMIQAMMNKRGAPNFAGTVWVYMDGQAEEHRRYPKYAQPEPVGFDADELRPA